MGHGDHIGAGPIHRDRSTQFVRDVQAHRVRDGYKGIAFLKHLVGSTRGIRIQPKIRPTAIQVQDVIGGSLDHQAPGVGHVKHHVVVDADRLGARPGQINDLKALELGTRQTDQVSNRGGALITWVDQTGGDDQGVVAQTTKSVPIGGIVGHHVVAVAGFNHIGTGTADDGVVTRA